jgi:hypothetical protein
VSIRITGVRAFETAPQPGCNLIVVKNDTKQPALRLVRATSPSATRPS